MQSRRILFWGLIVATGVLAASPARGQRYRLAQYNGYDAQTTPVQPGAAPPSAITPLAPPTYDPNFDPYSNRPGGTTSPPALLGPPATVMPGSGATDPFCGPSYGPAYPSVQPPTLFPSSPSFAPAPLVTDPPLKLFQNIRAEGTYIGDDGNDSRSLEIVEWEVATTLAYPNFAYSGQPLLISPGFAMNHWSGPFTDPANGFFADLPSEVYGAWTDFGWFPNSRFAQQVSYELTGRIGIYSDFDTFNEDSVRTMGTALIKLRITPTLTAKAGVEYIDRVDKKLLPAGGVLWTPNAHTRWDIYFPRPKLATYFTTLGNTEIWWYVGGEYGGDSWTIERGPLRGRVEDRVDYNDIRVALGLEWFNPYGLKGFVEGGYAFEREVVYVRFPQDNFSPDDTFLIRAGLAY
ncbi:MAG: hypothetical protein KY475_00710 [Planctomycetes bacterium]|nr:hypothetical protein [Planctomycetota bacterium]